MTVLKSSQSSLQPFNASARFPLMPEQTTYTYKLNQTQQDTLKHILRDGNYQPMKIEHTQIAARTPEVNVALYKSGKCVVQGRGATEFVQFVMEPLVLETVGLGYEDLLNPEAIAPHIGVDESGKGDFFGPLVTAAAYLDESLAQTMRDMGVRDSKSITSDDKALGLGRELRRLLGKRFALVIIGPEAYNRLYSKMRNVNSMLAWAHARAIENLLEIEPACPRAISDQFGNEKLVKNALMKKGREIELVQMPRAESDLAVAAASILAREAFLNALAKMREQYDAKIPKGASAAVRESAEDLVKKHGPEILVKTVKCHFKTTDQVLTATGHSRKDLPAEGQAVSRTSNFQYRRKKTPPAE